MRDYNDDYSSDSSYGAMESVHNSGAEDGAPDGATMDSEKSRHGKLFANDDNQTIHFPKSKIRRTLPTTRRVRKQSVRD